MKPIAPKRAARKWQLTINNPIGNGCTHETVIDALRQTPCTYFCLCDEIGEQGTLHTHIYVVYENAVMFDTMKKRFPAAHIEATRGSSQDNREYIRKEGKWQEDGKKETNLPETFEEYGEMPQDARQKNETVSACVLEMIKDGCSNAAIIDAHPSYLTKADKIEQARQLLRAEQYQEVWRDIHVTYLFGETGTGKTRSVMEQYGYSNVFRVTNYQHPFDGYNGQDVIVFEEFRSSLPIGDMLTYLDGYPCTLPCRYANKVACFTKVYIISNISLEEQYPNIQFDQPTTWNAFVRRIHTTHEYRNGTDVPFCEEEVAIIEHQS